MYVFPNRSTSGRCCSLWPPALVCSQMQQTDRESASKFTSTCMYVCSSDVLDCWSRWRHISLHLDFLTLSQMLPVYSWPIDVARPICLIVAVKTHCCVRAYSRNTGNSNSSSNNYNYNKTLRLGHLNDRTLVVLMMQLLRLLLALQWEQIECR